MTIVHPQVWNSDTSKLRATKYAKILEKISQWLDCHDKASESTCKVLQLSESAVLPAQSKILNYHVSEISGNKCLQYNYQKLNYDIQ
jgi:hypothetical protein